MTGATLVLLCVLCVSAVCANRSAIYYGVAIPRQAYKASYAASTASKRADLADSKTLAQFMGFDNLSACWAQPLNTKLQQLQAREVARLAVHPESAFRCKKSSARAV